MSSSLRDLLRSAATTTSVPSHAESEGQEFSFCRRPILAEIVSPRICIGTTDRASRRRLPSLCAAGSIWRRSTIGASGRAHWLSSRSFLPASTEHADNDVRGAGEALLPFAVRVVSRGNRGRNLGRPEPQRSERSGGQSRSHPAEPRAGGISQVPSKPRRRASGAPLRAAPGAGTSGRCGALRGAPCTPWRSARRSADIRGADPSDASRQVKASRGAR